MNRTRLGNVHFFGEGLALSVRTRRGSRRFTQSNERSLETIGHLLELANENSGVDNISVIIARILQRSDGVLDRLKIWKRNSG